MRCSASHHRDDTFRNDVPVGYSSLWAIGGLIALVIDRGRSLS